MKRQNWWQGLCLAMVVFLVFASQQTFAAQIFYINNTRVNLRSTPTAAKDNILSTIEKEIPIEVLSRRGSWFQVRLSDGREGWVSKWVLASRGLPDPDPPKQEQPRGEKPRERTAILGSTEDMIFIPGGTAIVGSDEREIQDLVKKEGVSHDMLIDELPQKSIVFQGFYIDRYEVTNTEYKTFVDAARYQPPLNWEDGNYPTGMGNLPVTFVSWDDAYAYAEWAEKRLPTAEEWEIASRGPQGQAYPWGESFDTQNVNVDRLQNGLVEGGTHADDLSGYDVNDMGGNVMEWTASQYKGSKDFFVLKGSSWVGKTFEARGANRTPGEAIYQLSHIGFRCAKSVE
ncbi:MAG: SUMF1/EgtB/PvdO family nonheme iron enzyme [bacterium]|nr:SUMF1/EgtB/PvdO family nonheme iron enzyme [bacterium]